MDEKKQVMLDAAQDCDLDESELDDVAGGALNISIPCAGCAKPIAIPRNAKCIDGQKYCNECASKIGI